jgi:hypothetical protein
MISADTSPSRQRLVAFIVPGAGPHVVAPYGVPTDSMRPRVSVADELAACLTMLDDYPERFERAAASWHARWCSGLEDLTLVDAHTALTALESLSGPNGTDAARVLRYLCVEHGQRATAEVLERWIARREPGTVPTAMGGEVAATAVRHET